MYSGAVRAGKTFALALKCYTRAMTVGAREILCRKTLDALKGTTLRSLLEGDGNTPPILTPGTYIHNQSKKIIRLIGGGEIIYFGLVNDGDSGVQQRIGSYTATGVNIDEATELEPKDYRMLLSRPSLSIPGLRRQVNLACNPGSPSHFLAERFAPPGSGYTTPFPNCVCIATQTKDNTHLDAEYLEMLDRESGTLWHRRFVLGLWCGSEGLVYDRWDRSIHTRDVPNWTPVRAILAVDYGYTNPFAVLRIEMDADQRVRVRREVYERKKQPHEQLELLKSVVEGGLAPEAVIVDPSASQLCDAIRGEGLTVVPANNSVYEGIMAVQARLADRGDGEPGLTVERGCSNTIREAETYEWKPDRDDPVKKWDHAMDALRYGVMYFDASPERIIGEGAADAQEITDEAYHGDVVYAGRLEEELSLQKRIPDDVLWQPIEDSEWDGQGWRVWCDLIRDERVVFNGRGIWRPAQNRTYCIACAASAVGESTMVAVCRETKEQVGEYSAKGLSTEQFARAAVRAAIWFGGSTKTAYMIWRGDGYGRTFGQAVTRGLAYGNFYRDIDEGRTDRPRSTKPGWHASTPKTLELVEMYQAALKAREWVPRSKRLMEQLSRYVWFSNAKIGPIEQQQADATTLLTHADLVIPAMLSCYALTHMSIPSATKRKAEYGTRAWLEEQEEAKKTGRGWWQ